MQNKTYVVLYPFGTGARSYKLFDNFGDAAAFLDNEADHTNIILPDDRKITIGKISKSIEEIEQYIADYPDSFDFDVDSEDAILSLLEEEGEDSHEDVSFWRGREVWAERSGDCYTYLAEAEDDKPEAEEGGEVVLAWSDGDEIYETQEELASANAPSYYLINF
jgi:hypothetical protein